MARHPAPVLAVLSNGGSFSPSANALPRAARIGTLLTCTAGGSLDFPVGRITAKAGDLLVFDGPLP